MLPGLLLPRSYQRGLLTNLVGYWPLQFPTGGAADLVDLSDNGLTLTDNATVTASDGGPGGRIPYGTHCTAANLEFLSRLDSAALAAAKYSTWCVWVKLTTKSATNWGIFTKDDGALNREYRLYYKTLSDRLTVDWSENGSLFVGNLEAATFGSPPTNLWFFVVFGTKSHPTENTNGFIQVNNGAQDLVNLGGFNAFNSTSALNLGRTEEGAIYMDGDLAGAGYWQRELTRSELTYLYNNGNGREFRQGHGFR